MHAVFNDYAEVVGLFVVFSLQPRTTSLLNGLSSCNAHNAKQLSAAWDVDHTCEYHLKYNNASELCRWSRFASCLTHDESFYIRVNLELDTVFQVLVFRYKLYS